jgi:hypothetical protein
MNFEGTDAQTWNRGPVAPVTWTDGWYRCTGQARYTLELGGYDTLATYRTDIIQLIVHG